MDAAELKELFSPFGPVEVRRMFGGMGIYADSLCFAIEDEGDVYLKADAATQDAFKAAGSTQFVVTMRGKPQAMGYWRLVADAYDDAEALRHWAGLGLAAARRAAAKKTGKLKASARSR